MKNTILIDPVDDEMALLANAVSILNDYKTAGFLKRDAFVQLIVDSEKTYCTLDGIKQLNNFWAGRVKDEKLNNDLVLILEKMKNS